jgi:predicted MFS family arabinose efflux permease
MSLMNGVMPIGSLVGCILARYLMKWLTNKNCLYLADALSIPSLITLIPEFYSMMAFRFLLGIANGINSVIMPIQVKHLCPEKHLI